MSTILAALALLAQTTPGLLVSPADLVAALKDPATVVIFVGNNPADFELGHIPGARFVAYGQIAVDANGLSSELPPVEQLRQVLAAAGISDKSKVVIYGSPIAASRLFFTLDYLGHPNARLLNGGVNAWKASGGTIETGPPMKHRLDTDRVSLTPKPQPERVVSADWIKERLSTPTLRQAQGRPERSRGAKITLLDSTGNFLPDAESRKKLEAIGARPGTPLVSYCMVGMRASVTYFVSRHLGYDARMYDGSIVDWTARKLPAVTGRQQ